MPVMKSTHLTPSMRAALDLLAERGDRALVRSYSQWWVAESEHARARGLSPEHRDPAGRLRASAVFWNREQDEEVTVIPTASVAALVARRLMKFTGPKRLVIAGGGKRKDHWRAELTPAALALRADQAEAAAAVVGQVLPKIASSAK